MSAAASAVASCATPRTARYQRRRPEQTLWYRIVQTHFATWLDLASGEFGVAPPGYVERTFRRYLECGILAHGFARAYCDTCQHDFLIAYSCKGRGVCPSCNTRRMAETAAHLVDHVFPPLPVRQWVLAVPKRLRYFLLTDAALQGAVLRIFLSEVERALRTQCSPAQCPSTINTSTKSSESAARIGAVAFIHRFGSSLNAHVHFHCCVIDGVFEPSVTGDTSDDSVDATVTNGVSFHAAHQLDTLAIQAVQTRARQRILRAFVRRGLIDKDDAKEMAAWEHGGGFSVDASVCIEGNDRAGLERLLRYCARPPFALEHLHQHDAEHVVYHNPKPHQGGPRELVLTPLELIDKIAALIPPPRTHRHRYYGVLAPNAPMRAAVTALAPLAISPVGAGVLCMAGCPLRGAPTPLKADTNTAPASKSRAAARYLWAMLLARIYEAFPLNCPICHSQMRIIAFINDTTTLHKILNHIGESTESPKIAQARGPPLWEAASAAERAAEMFGDAGHAQWALPTVLFPEPPINFDQRIGW